MINSKVSYNFRIGEYTQGAVVRVIADSHHNLIGHIQGFSMNYYNEIVVRVALCNGKTLDFHNTSKEVLK